MPDEAIKKQTASITLEGFEKEPSDGKMVLKVNSSPLQLQGKQPSSDVAAISSPSSIHVFGSMLDTFFGTPVELMIVADSHIGFNPPEST